MLGSVNREGIVFGEALAEITRTQRDLCLHLVWMSRLYNNLIPIEPGGWLLLYSKKVVITVLRSYVVCLSMNALEVLKEYWSIALPVYGEHII